MINARKRGRAREGITKGPNSGGRWRENITDRVFEEWHFTRHERWVVVIQAEQRRKSFLGREISIYKTPESDKSLAYSRNRNRPVKAAEATWSWKKQSKKDQKGITDHTETLLFYTNYTKKSCSFCNVHQLVSRPHFWKHLFSVFSGLLY